MYANECSQKRPDGKQAFPRAFSFAFSRLPYGNPGRAASGAAYTIVPSISRIIVLRQHRCSSGMALRFVGRGLPPAGRTIITYQTDNGERIAIFISLVSHCFAAGGKPPPYDVECLLRVLCLLAACIVRVTRIAEATAGFLWSWQQDSRNGAAAAIRAGRAFRARRHGNGESIIAGAAEHPCPALPIPFQRQAPGAFEQCPILLE